MQIIYKRKVLLIHQVKEIDLELKIINYLKEKIKMRVKQFVSKKNKKILIKNKIFLRLIWIHKKMVKNSNFNKTFIDFF
jgi:hypothetical protein